MQEGVQEEWDMGLQEHCPSLIMGSHRLEQSQCVANLEVIA